MIYGQNLIIVGDFNTPNFKSHAEIENEDRDIKSEVINNFLEFFELKQFNDVSNINNRLRFNICKC